MFRTKKLTKDEKIKSLILLTIGLFIHLSRYMSFGVAFTGLGALFLASSFYFFDQKKDYSFATIITAVISVFVLVMFVVKYQDEIMHIP